MLNPGKGCDFISSYLRFNYYDTNNLTVLRGWPYRLWRPLTPLLRRLVQGLDVIPPLLPVGALEAAIIGDQAVDLALDISRLSVDSATASVAFDLLPQLPEEGVSPVVVCVEVLVDLVGLVDLFNCLLDIPEAARFVKSVIGQALLYDCHLLIDRDIVAESAELALEADALRVIRRRVLGVKWSAALRVGVVVVVLDLISIALNTGYCDDGGLTEKSPKP